MNTILLILTGLNISIVGQSIFDGKGIPWINLIATLACLGASIYEESK